MAKPDVVPFSDTESVKRTTMGDKVTDEVPARRAALRLTDAELADGTDPEMIVSAINALTR